MRAHSTLPLCVDVLMNASDRVHRVDHIDCKQSGLLEHGLCEVELFVSAQSFATDEADWGICESRSAGRSMHDT